MRTLAGLYLERYERLIATDRAERSEPTFGRRRRAPGAYAHDVIVTLIVLGLVVLLVLYLIYAYNGLVRSRNGVDNSWAQIDVQLKRRIDLIPNLLETVKGYAAHERQTLEAVMNHATRR